MKKSELEKIVDKRCRHLQEEQRRLGEDVDANHNFRVEIKKLRALLRLLRQEDDAATALRLPKPVRQLYTTVGDVRSCQLQKAFVILACKELDSPPPAGYLQWLQQKEIEATERVRGKAKQVSILKLRDEILRSLPAAWDKESAANYLRETKTRLAAYLAAAALTDDALHDIRKLLKDLLYVWPYLEGVVAEIFPPQFFNRETCQQLAERLGSFQDCCVALTLFHPDLLPDLSAEEQQRLVLIREVCNRRKEGERKALVDRLQVLKNEIRNKMQVQTTVPVSTGNAEERSTQE
ncbi:CHAD domain-containing protein [Flavisolibacter sp. BT320]|nr:CHAD domain-containing protein [Flavisolibacter longurius]